MEKKNKPAPQFKNVNEPTFNDFVNEIEREREEEERKRIDAARKAIRAAYWRNWDKLPSVWVARDDDGSLWIYTTKPVKGGGMFSCSASGDMFQIDDSVPSIPKSHLRIHQLELNYYLLTHENY